MGLCKYIIVLIAILMCSCSGGSGGDSDIGSFQETNAQFLSLNHPTRTINSQRIFELLRSAERPFSFSIPSVQYESALESERNLLSPESPIRISIPYENVTGFQSASNPGFWVQIGLTNYTAEENVSNTFPQQRVGRPIGRNNHSLDHENGVLSALCRGAKVGGETLYSCYDDFAEQNYYQSSGFSESVEQGDINIILTITGVDDYENTNIKGLTYTTSIPIVLK